MSIRQFSGRIFFNDKAMNLKIGGPVNEDGQQLAKIVKDQIVQADIPAMPSPATEARH
jgi:hypothetical protein